MKQSKNNMNLAVLIDGDNIPSAHVTEMMEEIAKYGNPTINGWHYSFDITDKYTVNHTAPT